MELNARASPAQNVARGSFLVHEARWFCRLPRSRRLVLRPTATGSSNSCGKKRGHSRCRSRFLNDVTSISPSCGKRGARNRENYGSSKLREVPPAHPVGASRSPARSCSELPQPWLGILARFLSTHIAARSMSTSVLRLSRLRIKSSNSSRASAWLIPGSDDTFRAIRRPVLTATSRRRDNQSS